MSSIPKSTPKLIYSNPVFTFRAVSVYEDDISKGLCFYLRCERCIHEGLEQVLGSSPALYLGIWSGFHEFRNNITLELITDWLYYLEQCPELQASCFQKPTLDIVQCRRCTGCLSLFTKQSIKDLLHQSYILACL